jgi:hypothetical protein
VGRAGGLGSRPVSSEVLVLRRGGLLPILGRAVLPTVASAKNVDGWRPCQQAALACGIKDVLVRHGWRWYNHGKSVVSDDRILPFGRAGRALLCLGAPVHNASTVSCVFFGFFGRGLYHAGLPLMLHKPAGHGVEIWSRRTAYAGLATASYNSVMGSRKSGSTSPPSKASVRSKMLTCVGD